MGRKANTRESEEWTWRSLGELANFTNGLNFSRGQDGPLVQVVGVRDFQDRDTVRLSELDTVRIGRALRPSEFLKKGDLVFVRSNGNRALVGRCLLVEGDPEQTTHSGFTIPARFFSNAVRPEFVSVYIKTGVLRKQTQIEGGGTNISNLNQSILSGIRIPIPPQVEQDSILRFLSMWDRAIGESERLLALKQRRKRALMQQLLTGQQCFPEFAKSKSTRDTLLGLIAVDWPLNPISTVFERVRRKNGTSTDRVLTASGQHGLVNQREYFDRNVAGVSLEGYYLLERGEFAYNRSAMKGYPYGAIKRLDAHDCGAVSTLYHCFRLKDKESDSDFFMHLFEFGLLNRQLRRICQVGGRAHGLLNVTAGDFEKMLVPVPSREEQVRIAAVLNECDKEIEYLKAQLEAFRKQKKGLMQQLLTGKVRVPTNTAM